MLVSTRIIVFFYMYINKHTILSLGTFLFVYFYIGLSTILPLLSAVSFYFLPESPVWLVRRGYIDIAKKALVWLRGSNSTKVT